MHTKIANVDQESFVFFARFGAFVLIDLEACAGVDDDPRPAPQSYAREIVSATSAGLF
jgi:hypothetical protein